MWKLLRTSEYRRIAGSLGRLAEGDLSHRPVARTSNEANSVTAILGLAMRSLKALVRAVDHSSKRLHGKMEEMREESAIVSEQVEGVTSTIREMATGMQDASEHMTGIADEMTRIHRYIEEVKSKNGAIVDSTVRLAREVAAGRQEIGDAKERMNAIVAESTLVYERMERLGQAVERIARITQLIEEISGQTQLLALNANIEAARAGEQGAGFAVVAKEISGLAAQTKRETAGIRAQIRDVTQGSAELTDSIGGMHAAVKGGARSLESASGQYGKIEAFLGGIVGDMREVDERLGGVTGSTLAIADSVNQTTAMIQQVAAGSEEVLASAEVQQTNLLKMNDNLIESSRMSLALRSSVSQFKLPSQERNHPIQKEMSLWMETAMAIRAIMVSMIESDSPERIREWNRQKEQHEAILEERMRDVESKLRTEHDRRSFDSLRSAWQQFAAVKDQNAKWMLEGKREEAKAALVSKGRIAFKQTMDLAAEWMEDDVKEAR